MTPLGGAEPHDPRYVYTFWDDRGRALYVGCTVNFARRLVSHQGQRPWFGEVARIDVTVHPDEVSGLAAETRRIRELNPIHNSVHTDHSALVSLPCRRCHRGVHSECLGVNRDGDACRCQVCATSELVTA